MAQSAVAIREIVTLPDQRVLVRYSFNEDGTSPAPGWSSEVEFQNLEAVRFALSDLNFSEQQMVRLHLAMTWLQPNGSFGNINQVTNKTIIFDSFAANPLRKV